jgi:hypothetical protein
MPITISLPRFLPGEARTVTTSLETKVKSLVAEFGIDNVGAEVVEACDQVVKAAGPLADLDESTFVERRKVDNAADRVISSTDGVCEDIEWAYDQNVVELDDEQKQQVEDAKLIRTELLPDGVGFTRGRWAAQYGTTDILLQNAAKPKVSIAIKRMALAPRFRLLRQLHVIYGQRMGYTTTEGNEGPMEIWTRATRHYMFTVMVRHDERNPLCDDLLEPIETEAANVRQADDRSKPSSAKTVKARDEDKEPSEPSPGEVGESPS